MTYMKVATLMDVGLQTDNIHIMDIFPLLESVVGMRGLPLPLLTVYLLKMFQLVSRKVHFRFLDCHTGDV